MIPDEFSSLKRIAQTRLGWSLEYNISGPKTYPQKTAYFIVGRHWNSDTPITPRKNSNPDSETSMNAAIGGGYFLQVRDVGIAVDPGHAFLRMLYERHEITARDIKAIVITHFHPDHCGDIANYLTLSRERGFCPVIYAPSPVIQYLKLLDTPRLVMIWPGLTKTYRHNHEPIVNFEFLPALHWQTITSESLMQSPFNNFVDFHMSAVGLKIDVIGNRKMEFSSIIITGDTIFPRFNNKGNDFSSFCYDLYLDPRNDHVHLNQINQYPTAFLENLLRVNFANCLAAYLDRSADIVCFHIGSIEKQFAQLNSPINLDFQYEGFHLGVLGVIRLLLWMNSRNLKLGIITEWGEELRGERKNISKFIGGFWRFLMFENEAREKLGVPFLPSDVDFMIDMTNGLIKCSDDGILHHYTHMAAEEKLKEFVRYRSLVRDPDLAAFETTCNWKR